MSTTTAQHCNPYSHQIHGSRELQKLLSWCTGRSSPEEQESCLLLHPSVGKPLQRGQNPALPALQSSWEMPPLLRTQGPELGPFWQRSMWQLPPCASCVPPRSSLSKGAWQQQLLSKGAWQQQLPVSSPGSCWGSAPLKIQVFVAFEKHLRFNWESKPQSLMQSLTAFPETTWLRLRNSK